MNLCCPVSPSLCGLRSSQVTASLEPQGSSFLSPRSPSLAVTLMPGELGPSKPPDRAPGALRPTLAPDSLGVAVMAPGLCDLVLCNPGSDKGPQAMSALCPTVPTPSWKGSRQEQGWEGRQCQSGQMAAPGPGERLGLVPAVGQVCHCPGTCGWPSSRATSSNQDGGFWSSL